MSSTEATDIETADRLGLRFNVAVKESQGKSWVDRLIDVGLKEALGAKTSDAFEMAVFLRTENGEFVYWSSLAPDVLNSEVLSLGTLG